MNYPSGASIFVYACHKDRKLGKRIKAEFDLFPKERKTARELF